MLINTLMNIASQAAGISDAELFAHEPGSDGFQKVWEKMCNHLHDYKAQHKVVQATLKAWRGDQSAVYMTAQQFLTENDIMICPHLSGKILPFLH